VSYALTRNRGLVTGQDRVLQSLSYKNVLKRGYAVVRDPENRPLTRASDVSVGQFLEIEFADERINTIACGDSPPASPPGPETARKKPTARAAPSGEPPKQGSLF
jgi:exodeoxyribonuclease VII large subunit